MSQQALARQANVGRQWLVEVEQGRHSGAEIGMILAVLAALGVEMQPRRIDQPAAGDRPQAEGDQALTLTSLLGGLQRADPPGMTGP